MEYYTLPHIQRRLSDLDMKCIDSSTLLKFCKNNNLLIELKDAQLSNSTREYFTRNNIRYLLPSSNLKSLIDKYDLGITSEELERRLQ